MSGKTKAVPDAWDEDWETIADREEQVQPAEDQKKVSSKVSKAQRRAQHAEFNRQLWQEAESEQTFHFLESRATSVPLKSDYKQPVTVLSRKPQIAPKPSPATATTAAAANGLDTSLSDLDINDKTHDAEQDDESGSDDDPASKSRKRLQEMTPEERQASTLRQREEKQRKYEEVRERLFGSSSATPSGASSPGSTTPPQQQPQTPSSSSSAAAAAAQSQNQNQKENNRWRGRNRQQGRGGDSSCSRENTTERREAPTTASGRSKQLYDPGYSAKPNSSYGQKKDTRNQQRRTTNNNNNNNTNNNDAADDLQQRPQAPVRNPRGPDGSGRGGFGFNQAGPGRGR